MGPRIRAQAVLAALAVCLSSCASAPTPAPEARASTPPPAPEAGPTTPAPAAETRPTAAPPVPELQTQPTRATGLSCGAFEFEGKIPDPIDPKKWKLEQRPRGFLSVRFVDDGKQIYAIGVLVKDESKYEPPFLVGPMPNIKGPIPPQQAFKEARRYPAWHAFYKQLFRAYGSSRPLHLVCRAADCPLTPEMPPPGLLGATTSYGTGSLLALEPLSTERAYASRATPEGQIATDAIQGVLGQSEDARRKLVIDTVERAVCAVKILTVPK